MKKRIVLLFITCLLSAMGFSQDPQFSQFYSSPLYLNPAFTGNTIKGRFVGNYRKQWPNIGDFSTFAFSYDYNLRAINSGLGLLIVQDNINNGTLSQTSIGALYSYKAKLRSNLYMNTGVQASYGVLRTDLSKITFGDQIYNQSPETVENFNSDRTSYMDISAGVLLYTEKMWFGFSSHHLNTPSVTFVRANNPLPIKYSIHSGIKIPFRTTAKGEITRSATAAINYKSQGKFDQFDIGAYYTLDKIIFGIWYRGLPIIKPFKTNYSNNDALILILGYDIGQMRFGYSYDITISKLELSTGGAHEISFIYEYTSRNRKRKKRKKEFLVPCPRF